MARWTHAAAALAMTSVLAGCANWMLAPGDRNLLCRIEVDEKFDAAEFRPHPLSNPGGALTGAAGGALQGAIIGAGVGAIVYAPIGAVVGAMCAAAAAAHPTADADFQRILGAADAGYLKRSLEAALNAPRGECPAPGAGAQTDAVRPGAVVTLDKLVVGMECLTGKQAYVIVVNWHTAAAGTGRALNQGTTSCTMKSYRDVDDWFAYPDRAREEIERALDKTGRQVAVQVLAETGYGGCALRSRENGEIDGGP